MGKHVRPPPLILRPASYHHMDDKGERSGPAPIASSSSPRNYGLTMLRHVQWIFALLSHVLFVSVFNNAMTSIGLMDRVRVVPFMNMATLAYATIVVLLGGFATKLSTKSRYRMEGISVITDLLAAGTCLAKGAVLNSTRLDCQVLLQEKFLNSGLTRQAFDSLNGAMALRDSIVIDEIDRQCVVSMLIYWISIIAIISYSLSVLVTCIRLREYRRIIARNRKAQAEIPGEIEMAIESIVAAGKTSSASNGINNGMSQRSHSQERQTLQNLLPLYKPRSSQESNCSHVSDGLDPPAYVSRPASLYSVKGD